MNLLWILASSKIYCEPPSVLRSRFTLDRFIARRLNGLCEIQCNVVQCASKSASNVIVVFALTISIC